MKISKDKICLYTPVVFGDNTMTTTIKEAARLSDLSGGNIGIVADTGNIMFYDEKPADCNVEKVIEFLTEIQYAFTGGRV